MYVIKRTDKEYGDAKVEHNLKIQAETEAKRLARAHARETPEFTIYELVEVLKVTANVVIKIEHKTDFESE